MPVRVTKDLTDVRIRNARPTDKQYEVFDRSVGGFALRIAPSGSKTFVVNFRCNGKNRRMSLGNASVLSLADARAAAVAAKARAKSGIDPLDERRREQEQNQREVQIEVLKDERSFAAVADLYIQRYARGRGKIPNKKTWREDDRILQKYVVPKWGPLQIEDIGRSDVVALLDSIEDKSGVYMTNRVLATIRKLLNWAMDERALIESVPIGKKMMRKGEKKRTRVLSEDEIRSFWVAAGKLEYPFGPLFRLLLATGQRRDEVATMQWSQLDTKEALWTIPSYETKADRGDHIVPLNAVAMEVIGGLHCIDDSDLLFPTSSNPTRAVSGFSKAKARCDKHTTSKAFEEANMVALTDWRLHDLRRSCATTMQESLSVPPHIIGSILNHSPQSTMGVTSVYATGHMVEDRRRALNAWGQKLESILTGVGGDNVVPLKKEVKR
jgi:integrase